MDSATIASLISPAVGSCGLEVDRVEVVPAGRRRVVQIFLDGDGPRGRGPSLDEIAEATRSISAALDAADVTRGRPYTLEVSSRGVSRPLTEARHFRRNTGRLVEFALGESRLTGRILGADETGVDVDVDGTTRRIPLSEVTRALVQVELNRPVAGEDAADDAEDDADEDEEA